LKVALTILFLFVLPSSTACLRAADDPDFEKHPELVTYDFVRAWHSQGGLEGHPAPRVRYLDLKRNGSEAVFLGIFGAGRFMTYALFARTDHGWVPLSKEIDGNTVPFEVLPEKHGQWHDFMTIVPTWRGRGYWRFVYTWNGKRYIVKSSREIRDSELSRDGAG
jgi:hypothetical protein